MVLNSKAMRFNGTPKHIRIDQKDYIVVQEENKLPQDFKPYRKPGVQIKGSFQPSGKPFTLI